MQAHRNGPPLGGLPRPGGLDYLAQRTVLAELVITPPAQGDSIAYLIDRLPLPADTIEQGLAALQVVGLAERRGDLARATMPARYFEHLRPVML